MYGEKTRHVGVRVVVGASNQTVRQHLRDLLQAEPGTEVVAEFEPWDRVALRTIREGLLVLGLPAGQPDELTLNLHRLRGAGRCRVVAVVDRLDDDYLLTVLVRGGVLGIVGPHDSDELRAAVTAVADGLAYLTPRATSRILTWLAELPDAAAVALVDRLTARQRNILGLVATGKSNVEIAEVECLSVGTVKWHVNHLLRKLGCNDRHEATRIANAAQLIPAQSWLIPIPNRR